MMTALEYRPGQAVTNEDLVFLVGAHTPYGMLEHLSAEWVLAFRALGRSSYILQTGGPTGLGALQSLLAAGRPQAFVSFSGVNFDLLANDRLLYEIIDVPFVGLMFDDPAYYPQRHQVPSRHLALLFTDDDHLAASLRLSPAMSPRGRFRFGVRPPTEAPTPHSARDIALLFVKSPGDPELARREWHALPPALRTILNDVADATVWRSDQSLWSVVHARLADDGLVAGIEHGVGMATLVARVDHYVRLARAQRVVRALAPFPALIVGSGWRAHLPRDARATVLDTCPMHDTLALMSSARVVVNVQPNNRYAPHERALFGMQRGCCVLTDAATPLRDALGEEHIRAFDWSDDLEDVIASLVQKPDEGEAIGLRAAPFACAQWDAVSGARTVLRAVDSLAGLLSTRSPITLPAALSA